MVGWTHFLSFLGRKTTVDTRSQCRPLDLHFHFWAIWLIVSQLIANFRLLGISAAWWVSIGYKQIWCDFDRASSLICGKKCQLDATEVFIADLIACSTCFGHHYAHHQELKSIIRWLLPVVFRAVIFKLLVCSTPDQQLENHSTKYHGQQPPCNTLELLMMGIVVPETCWASNKICNKNLCCI